MTQGELLDEEELDFLLQQADVQTAEELFDPTDSDNTKVTIRGDLDNIDLADIFQTLSISKMRGILKVINPLETRLVYFDQGHVRLMHANRKGTRRVGQRLVRCGILTIAQLRQALLEQKRHDTPLGQTLIDLGFLTQEELTAVLNNQLEDDLHNIFIWSSGNFEFYKNKPDNEEILEEINKTPGFEVNGILLEAARRRDEWSQILEHVESVHAIPVFPPDAEFPKMSGHSLTVCEAIDNFSTISDLSETTMLGLFHCAKAVCDLKRDGLVELADPRLTLKLALDANRKSDTKRALQLCQNLRQLASDLDFELCEQLASVLEACREPRLSANILLECAAKLETLDDRIGIARRALGVDRHAIAVMRFIRKEMLAGERTSHPEYLDTLEKLCDALSADGEDDDALDVFKELESISPDVTSLLGRKAKLLQRVGREDEAIAALLDLRTEHEKEGGDQGRLKRLYEQILKIDPGHREVQRALRVLKIGKTRSNLHNFYACVGVFVVVISGYFAWQWSETEKLVNAAATRIRLQLDSRNTTKAQQLLAKAQTDIGPQAMWERLQTEISDIVLKERATAVAARTREYEKVLNSTADELQKGNLEKALSLYKRLLAHSNADKLVRRIAPGQLKRITTQLEATRDGLKTDLPDPPPPLAKYETLTNGLSILNQKDKIDTSLARTMLVSAEHNTVKQLWPKKDLRMAQTMALEIQSLAQLVATRLHDYKLAIKKIEKNRRLDPIFRNAQRAEENNDFLTAEKLYRHLLAEFSGNAILAPGFRDKMQKYASINRHLEMLSRAVKTSDFRDARAFYLYLKRSYKGYRWGEMIQLPLRVVTTPADAEVWMNGKLAGRSPMTLQYRPADKNWIKIQLKGFSPEQVTVTGDKVGLVRSVLNRTPKWTLTTEGAVDKHGVAGRQDRVFLVDRTGAVIAWSLSHCKQLWRRETGDLSGLLTRPVLIEDLVLVASIDGTLRALEESTGEIIWSIDDLPSESAPVTIGSTLALASERKLVFVDMRTRKVTRKIDLTWTVRQDLHVVDDEAVLVTQDDGTVRLILIEDGTDRWPAITLDRGLVCEPLIIKEKAIFATDEGRVAAYNLASGKRVWQRSRLGELHWKPASDGQLVFIAAQPTPEATASVVSFSLATGKPGPRFNTPTGEFWSTHPTVIADKVIVGSRSGLFRVLNARNLTPCYHIRGSGPASAQPMITKSGTALFTFEGKKTLVYPGMK